jgi:hypothetical protein
MYWVATPQNFLHHSFRIHLPMKMEQTQSSETSDIKYHAPENNPKGYTRHTERGESLKSITLSSVVTTVPCGFWHGEQFSSMHL